MFLLIGLDILFKNSSQPCIEYEIQQMIRPITRSRITVPWAGIGHGVSMPVEKIMDFYFKVANQSKDKQSICN